jgi:hypothetical protein
VSGEQYSAAVHAIAELSEGEALDLLSVMMQQHGWCGTMFTSDDFRQTVLDRTTDTIDDYIINVRAVELMDALDYDRAQERMTEVGWEYLYRAHDEVFRGLP